MVLKNGMQGLPHGALVGGHQHCPNGHDLCENEDVGGCDSFKQDMRELVDLLSKLNPMAEEFVPGSGTPFLGMLVHSSTVTDEQLASLFSTDRHIVDCRVCGDPNLVLRFAFIEFFDEGAKAALSLAGTVLGFYPVRVLPSKTAIAPVNPTFLPRYMDLVQHDIDATIGPCEYKGQNVAYCFQKLLGSDRTKL